MVRLFKKSLLLLLTISGYASAAHMFTVAEGARRLIVEPSILSASRSLISFTPASTILDRSAMLFDMSEYLTRKLVAYEMQLMTCSAQELERRVQALEKEFGQTQEVCWAFLTSQYGAAEIPLDHVSSYGWDKLRNDKQLLPEKATALYKHLEHIDFISECIKKTRMRIAQQQRYIERARKAYSKTIRTVQLEQLVTQEMPRLKKVIYQNGLKAEEWRKQYATIQRELEQFQKSKDITQATLDQLAHRYKIAAENIQGCEQQLAVAHASLEQINKILYETKQTEQQLKELQKLYAASGQRELVISINRALFDKGQALEKVVITCAPECATLLAEHQIELPKTFRGHALHNYIAQHTLTTMNDAACIYMQTTDESVRKYAQATMLTSAQALELLPHVIPHEAVARFELTAALHRAMNIAVEFAKGTGEGVAAGSVMTTVLNTALKIPGATTVLLGQLIYELATIESDTLPKMVDEFLKLSAEEQARQVGRLFGGVIGSKKVGSLTTTAEHWYARLKDIIVAECTKLKELIKPGGKLIHGISIAESLVKEIEALVSAGKLTSKADVVVYIKQRHAPFLSTLQEGSLIIERARQPVLAGQRAVDAAADAARVAATSAQAGEVEIKSAQAAVRHPDAGDIKSTVGAVEAGKQFTQASVYRTVKETGEKCRIVRPLDVIKAELEWAPHKYEEIRRCADDVAKIAKNTGMPAHKIQKIKDHLFYKEHVLDHGLAKLDPDPEIASAWDRLYSGDFIKNDLKLLDHEYFESRFENLFKTNLRVAHETTQNAKARPWNAPNFAQE